jgi:hypothetical protein
MKRGFRGRWDAGGGRASAAGKQGGVTQAHNGCIGGRPALARTPSNDLQDAEEVENWA